MPDLCASGGFQEILAAIAGSAIAHVPFSVKSYVNDFKRAFQDSSGPAVGSKLGMGFGLGVVDLAAVAKLDWRRRFMIGGPFDNLVFADNKTPVQVVPEFWVAAQFPVSNC